MFAPFDLDVRAIDRLGWTLLHFVWQGTIVALLAAVILASLARGSAKVRHHVLLVFFSVMVLCPVITFAILAPASASKPAHRAAAPVQFVEARLAAPVREANEPPNVSAAEKVAVPTFTEDDPASVASTTTTAWNERTTAYLPAALPWIVVIWGLGVALSTLRLFTCWWRIRRLVTVDVEPFTHSWSETTGRLAQQLGVHRAVRFLQSHRAAVPMVIGWVRPVVLIPASLLVNLSPQEIESLLAHELGHIRRWDDVVNLLQMISEILLFYHPAVWWLSSRLRNERENCCDDIAVRTIGDKVVYSRALMAAAELASGPDPHLAVASRGGQLVQRIRRILGQERSAGRSGRLGLLATIACAAIAVLMTISILARSTSATASEAEHFASESDDRKTKDPIQLGSPRFREGIEHVRFLPDSKSLVIAVRSTGSFNSAMPESTLPAAVIDAVTGRVIRRLVTDAATTDQHVWTVLAISGDGRRIAFTRSPSRQVMFRTFGLPGSRSVVEIYDTLTSKPVCTISGIHAASGRSAAMNHDGTRIVSCGNEIYDNHAEVWDATTGKKLKSVALPKHRHIDCIAFDTSGRQIAIGDAHDILVWNWETSDRTSVFSEYGATAVAFAPDGIHSGTGRGGFTETRLWKFADKNMLFQFPISGSRAIVFTPDSRQMIAGYGYKHEIEVRDVRTGKVVRTLDSGGIDVGDLTVSPDGRLLASASSFAQGIRVWDLATGKRLGDEFHGHEQGVRDLRFSPDGDVIVTAGMDGQIAAWNASTGKLIHQLLAPSHRWAGGVNFSQNGQLVLAASLDKTNRVWNTASGELLHKLAGHGHTGATYAVALTEDNLIASFGADGKLRTVDPTTGQRQTEFEIVTHDAGHHEKVYPSRLSTDGSTLVVGLGDQLGIYTVNNGRRRTTIETKNAGHFDVSPDGKRVATTTALYDATSGEPLQRFNIQAGRPAGVSFSSDGRWIGVAIFGGESAIRYPGLNSGRNSLWLIDLETKQVRTRSGPEARPYAVAASPDGKRLAVACADNSVTVWDVENFETPPEVPSLLETHSAPP